MRPRGRALLPLLLTAAALVTAGRGGRLFAETPSWRLARGEVRVLCPLTVGGSFEARTRAITGAVSLSSPPAALGGEVAVDLKTLDTGIGLRNEHMRSQYLEVGRGEGYDTALLTDIHLGDVAADTFQGRTSFTGALRVHGVTRPVRGQAEIRRADGEVRVTASFPVGLDDYAIAAPRYLGVGVRNEIEVRVSLAAIPAAASATR